MRRNRCATWHPAVLRGAEWMQRAWGARPWRCGSQRQAAASAWRPPVSSTTHTRPRAEPASCDEHGMPHGRPLGYAARRSSSARRGLNVRLWRPRRRLTQRADQVPVPRKGTRAVSIRKHVSTWARKVWAGRLTLCIEANVASKTCATRVQRRLSAFSETSKLLNALGLGTPAQNSHGRESHGR